MLQGTNGLYGFESDNADEPETYRWVKLTMKTLQAASHKDTSEEDCKAANQRVSKLLKVPKEDSVLTYDASVERKAGVRFNAKEHTVDIDLSEHSRLTEHVRQWIKLSKTEKKESLAIRLIDKDGDVVAFATDVEKNKKKRKKDDKSYKREKKKRKIDISRGTAESLTTWLSTTAMVGFNQNKYLLQSGMCTERKSHNF